MNMQKYFVVYANRKPEDNIIIKNMFKNNMEINIGWTDIDIENNYKKIVEKIEEESLNQIIMSGFEIGWDKLVVTLKEKYENIKIKVICNTNDSLLYYDYERENFFKLLKLSKENKIDMIAFFRKGQYELYKMLGYKCCYLKENYILDSEMYKTDITQKKGEKMQIGIYPLNYTWDKNIFNQLCIPKFLDDSVLNFNCIDPRMDDFVTTMKIRNRRIKFNKIDENEIIDEVKKNDIIIATSFTEYVHPIFFLSMEVGIPCLIGDNSDFFNMNDELKECIVSNAEDNPIINANKVKKIIENKDKIKTLYMEWKKKYNNNVEKLVWNFINL